MINIHLASINNDSMNYNKAVCYGGKELGAFEAGRQSVMGPWLPSCGTQGQSPASLSLVPVLVR